MKILKQVIFCICLFFLTMQLNAQDGSNHFSELEKNSISGNIFGTSSIAGITYERIISKNIILEAGVGLIGIGAGVSYYPFAIEKSKLCPYLGAKVSTLVVVDVGGGAIGYIPFGLTLFSKHMLNYGLDIGPAYGKWQESDFEGNDGSASTIYFYGNLKIGLRF